MAASDRWAWTNEDGELDPERERVGRDLKAGARSAGVPLYRVAAAAGINPYRLSRLLNGHEPLSATTAARIGSAIEAETGKG